jgi:hypothetical protein
MKKLKLKKLKKQREKETYVQALRLFTFCKLPPLLTLQGVPPSNS